MLFQVRTGSEWHSTERRGCMVTVNNQPIYQALKPIDGEWLEVGSKGRHGKWFTAEYEIPIDSKVVFKASANSKPDIVQEFVVSADSDVDIDGYEYSGRLCGWIVSL